MDYKKYIADIQDFPIEGILFRDITPLMGDGEAFHSATQEVVQFAREVNAEIVVGPESRGFIFGCPVAFELGIGFVPVRKPGKLPRKTVSYSYALEYGKNELHVHKDSIKPGQRVLIVDDVISTGGSMKASCEVANAFGAEIVGCCAPLAEGDAADRDDIFFMQKLPLFFK